MNALPFSWFDIVVLALLGVGFYFGRKRGMSQEILLVLQWLVIVVVGSYYYEPLGSLLSEKTPFSLLFSYVAVYLGIAFTAKILFTNVKRAVGEKIFASDFFGRFEYYLGMAGGTLRVCCMLVAMLALLNAKLITDQERTRQAKLQEENFGSISFPTLATIQQEVLHNSLTGMFVRGQLSDLLIKPTPPDTKPVRREGPARKREQVVEEVIQSRAEHSTPEHGN